MTDVLERALVSAPFAARHAHQSVIGSFESLYDGVRLSEHGPEPRLADCAVGIVLHALSIGSLGVEVVAEVGLC